MSPQADIPVDFLHTPSIGAVIESWPEQAAVALTDAIGRALGGGSSEWSLLQQGVPPMTVTAESPSIARRPRKMAPEPKPETANQSVAHDPAKRANKTDLVLGLLQRPEGATIDQLVAATGWLPHTTRAALTGLKKKGHVILSEKVQGLRHYRIVGGAA